tara:strand:+ start:616 stop:1080 length:465 start_codon:yes stop_codon:yes gene_type:complete
MKKIIFTVIVLLNFSCNNSNEISEQEVKDTILGMFNSFSVESNDKNTFYNYVTDDYILYEMGKEMNATEFLEFASTFNIIEDDWEITNWNITIDKESAHAHFKNKGRFVTLNDGKKTLLNYQWLESAYLVKIEDELKIKFYFSDVVNLSSEELK